MPTQNELVYLRVYEVYNAVWRVKVPFQNRIYVQIIKLIIHFVDLLIDSKT